MWFKLPDGCSGISVERQQFDCEIRDNDGRGYFRAPDHFAPRILAIPGFATGEPPEGAPDDLPRSDPLRDGAIAQLSQENESLKRELADCRSDLIAASRQMSAVEIERNSLMDKVRELNLTIEGLREDIEDKPRKK